MNGIIESQNQRPVQDAREDLIILPQKKRVVNISQSEVLEFLEKHPNEWFTARQISKRLGITHGSCTNNLTRLIRHQLIRRRETDKRYTFEYKYKNEKY